MIVGKPAVSVVIPAFNCADYVGNAIDSVLAQTYSGPIEIIVVDDGSTDGIDTALQPYRSRIHIVKQRNRGIGGARNSGIKLATGKYVAFLDADDYWLPRRLAKMVAVGEWFPDSLIITDLKILNMRDGQLSREGYCVSQGLLPLFSMSARDQYANLLQGNFLNYMMMLPRRFLTRVGEFDETLRAAEDWDFQLRCLQRGMSVRLVPETLGVYRRFRPGATTTQRNANMVDSLVTVLSKHRSRISKRRWQLAVGERDKVRLRVALEQKRHLSAFVHGIRLAANGTFLKQYIAQRLLASPIVNGGQSHGPDALQTRRQWTGQLQSSRAHKRAS